MHLHVVYAERESSHSLNLGIIFKATTKHVSDRQSVPLISKIFCNITKITRLKIPWTQPKNLYQETQSKQAKLISKSRIKIFADIVTLHTHILGLNVVPCLIRVNTYIKECLPAVTVMDRVLTF